MSPPAESSWREDPVLYFLTGRPHRPPAGCSVLEIRGHWLQSQHRADLVVRELDLPTDHHLQQGGGGDWVRLKADLDPMARYLVLPDIDKCLVFVLSSIGDAGWSPPVLFLSQCGEENSQADT